MPAALDPSQDTGSAAAEAHIPQDFPDLPPFPSDVPTAPLLRLSLQRLLDDDPDESARLWAACCDVGFLYLDLRGAHGTVKQNADEHKTNGTAATLNGALGSNPSPATVAVDGDAFLRLADDLFRVAGPLFDLPTAEKQKYDLSGQDSYFGYKGVGAAPVDITGARDRNEFYNASKDDLLGLTAPLLAPACLTPHRPALAEFMTTSHAIVTCLLQHLTRALALPPDALTARHRLHARSGDQVRWVRAPPQPPADRRTALGAHTDYGSVTILFNRLGGLQIMPPGVPWDRAHPELTADSWQYVRPLPGHCVVNLGDALVLFTRGILRSNIHRVFSPPGAQADCVRTSLVYFSRPEDDVPLVPLEESAAVRERRRDDEEVAAVSSKDWILRRALGGRLNNTKYKDNQGTEAISAGR